MKQEDLIVGEVYKIKYSGQFCHSASLGLRNFIMDEKTHKATFLGQVNIVNIGLRNFFYILDNPTYIMFGCDRLDYIVTSEKKAMRMEVLNQIKVLEKDLQILKSKVK